MNSKTHKALLTLAVIAAGVQSMNGHTMFDELDRIFNSIEMPKVSVSRGAGLMNGKEFDDRFEYTVTVPGFASNEIELNVSELRGVVKITISGKKEVSDDQQEQGTIISRQYNVESFKVTKSIAADIEINKVSAQLKDGLLTVLLPKKTLEAVRNTVIPIQSK